jgi:hypothetical protein
VSALEASLAAGRSAAEELMRETVKMFRPVESGLDWSTGAVPETAEPPMYSGKARVKPGAQSRGEETNAGEQNVTLRDYLVSLPWSTVPGMRPKPGDVLDVTASPDARMVGLRLWVTGVQYSSTATAWRISAEDRS